MRSACPGLREAKQEGMSRAWHVESSLWLPRKLLDSVHPRSTFTLTRWSLPQP